jgi:hypothetical protein
VILREEIEERQRQWAEFHRWEDEHPPVERPAADIVADLGIIWEWLPPDVRERDDDPEKAGIQAMRAALARLKPSR